MNKKLITLLTSTLLAIFPIAVFAAVPENPGPYPWINIADVWTLIINILKFIWPIFVGIAILMFIVAGFTFLTSNGEPGKIKTAKDAVTWGVVGVIVAILAFSIVMIVQGWITPAPPVGSPGPAPQIGCAGNADCPEGQICNVDLSVCQPAVIGCTNVNASNYNAAANLDNGCKFACCFTDTDPLALQKFYCSNMTPVQCINNERGTITTALKDRACGPQVCNTVNP